VAVGEGVGMGVGVAKMFGATVGIIEVGQGLVPVAMLPTEAVVGCDGGLPAGGDVAVAPMGSDEGLPAGTLTVVVVHGRALPTVAPRLFAGDVAPAVPVC
jgi:hypothetical protein